MERSIKLHNTKRIMTLPDFLYCENKKDLPGAGLILATVPPYPFGRIILYRHDGELIRLTTNKPLVHAMVPGYRISINFAGTIAGSKLPLTRDVLDRLNVIFADMAKFYYEYKIEPRALVYKRYKYGK